METVAKVRWNPYLRESQVNPYPTYRQLRDEAPLYRNSEVGFWALSRHADVLAAYLDTTTFSNARGMSLDGLDQGVKGLMQMDPPEHTVHRRLLSTVFTPRRVAELEDRVREVAGGLLDDLRHKAEFDLVADYAARFPLIVISEMLGIPPSLRAEVRALADRLVTRVGEEHAAPEDAAAAKAELFALLLGLTRDRRARPGDDLVSRLIESELASGGDHLRLTDEEVASRFTEMAAAGHETTTRLVANGVVALWWYPDQRRAIVDDAALLADAIEEMLRWDVPNQFAMRWTTRPVELHGETVPADERVLLIRASANHDERVFERPELFDIRRSIPRHFGFGFGAHLCIGAPLARLETRVAFEELLTRFPDYDLVDSRIVRADGLSIRGIKTLPFVPSG